MVHEYGIDNDQKLNIKGNHGNGENDLYQNLKKKRRQKLIRQKVNCVFV